MAGVNFHLCYVSFFNKLYCKNNLDKRYKIRQNIYNTSIKAMTDESLNNDELNELIELNGPTG
jgi:hypothetical protein